MTEGYHAPLVLKFLLIFSCINTRNPEITQFFSKFPVDEDAVELEAEIFVSGILKSLMRSLIILCPSLEMFFLSLKELKTRLTAVLRALRFSQSFFLTSVMTRFTALSTRYVLTEAMLASCLWRKTTKPF